MNYKVTRINNLRKLKPGKYISNEFKTLSFTLNNSGDHVRVKNFLYNHHALVVEVVNPTTLLVIHYTTSGSLTSAEVSSTVASSGSCKTTKVFEIEMNVDLQSEEIELLEYEEGVALYTGQERVKRARERLDEKKYKLFRNNCECLINWAITDKNVSEQGESAIELIAAGVTAGVVGAAILHSTSDKKKDKNTD